MPAFNKVNVFVRDLAAGVHQLQTGSPHVFKVALSNTAPNAATMAVLADIGQIAAGNGYTAGGNSCALTSGAQTGGTFRLVLADPPQWSASGGSMAPFRYAWLYNDTPTSPNKPLIGWWDYGSTLTLNVGDPPFVVDFDPVTGVLTVA